MPRASESIRGALKKIRPANGSFFPVVFTFRATRVPADIRFTLSPPCSGGTESSLRFLGVDRFLLACERFCCTRNPEPFVGSERRNMRL